MYLNLIEIAESFGVSESVVESWIRDEGMPHMRDRNRLLFDRAQVAHWAAARGLATRAGFLTPENSVFATGCRLEPLLRTGGIWRDLSAAQVTTTLARIVAELPGVTPPVRQFLTQRVQASGGVTWAAMGDGCALPHLSARVALGREAGMIALLLLREPLTQAGPAPDNVPVTRLFFFLAPSPRAHLDLIGRLTRALRSGPLRDAVIQQATDADIFAAAAKADAGMANGKPAELRR
jgi:PTS system nitrogen regulatory IIA component